MRYSDGYCISFHVLGVSSILIRKSKITFLYFHQGQRLVCMINFQVVVVANAVNDVVVVDANAVVVVLYEGEVCVRFGKICPAFFGTFLSLSNRIVFNLLNRKVVLLA